MQLSQFWCNMSSICKCRDHAAMLTYRSTASKQPILPLNTAVLDIAAVFVVIAQLHQALVGRLSLWFAAVILTLQGRNVSTSA